MCLLMEISAQALGLPFDGVVLFAIGVLLLSTLFILNLKPWSDK